jgi:hypothetical protein
VLRFCNLVKLTTLIFTNDFEPSHAKRTKETLYKMHDFVEKHIVYIKGELGDTEKKAHAEDDKAWLT